MKPEQINLQIKDKLDTAILKTEEKRKGSWVVHTIDPSTILKATSLMIKELKCRLITATALQAKDGFEIYYHYSKDEIGMTINLHVILSPDKPEIESISNLSVAANWIEREMHELYGIEFLNHPEPEQLLSDGNWDVGTYPFKNNGKP